MSTPHVDHAANVPETSRPSETRRTQRLIVANPQRTPSSPICDILSRPGPEVTRLPPGPAAATPSTTPPRRPGDRPAVLSANGRYRYLLDRWWDPTAVAMALIGLNPSTADGTSDDATTRRAITFAKAAGCGSVRLVNTPGAQRRPAPSARSATRSAQTMTTGSAELSPPPTLRSQHGNPRRPVAR